MKSDVATANQDVTDHHGVINTSTKETTYKGDLTRRAAHETRHYWWGARHIFRSNKAVNSYAHKLSDQSMKFSYATVLGVVNAPTGAFAGLGAAYFAKISSDLTYFNSTHSKSKIYMDVNRALVYSIAVWHD